jgi:hypothetical protein
MDEAKVLSLRGETLELRVHSTSKQISEDQQHGSHSHTGQYIPKVALKVIDETISFGATDAFPNRDTHWSVAVGPCESSEKHPCMSWFEFCEHAGGGLGAANVPDILREANADTWKSLSDPVSDPTWLTTKDDGTDDKDATNKAHKSCRTVASFKADLVGWATLLLRKDLVEACCGLVRQSPLRQHSGMATAAVSISQVECIDCAQYPFFHFIPRAGLHADYIAFARNTLQPCAEHHVQKADRRIHEISRACNSVEAWSMSALDLALLLTRSKGDSRKHLAEIGTLLACSGMSLGHVTLVSCADSPCLMPTFHLNRQCEEGRGPRIPRWITIQISTTYLVSVQDNFDVVYTFYTCYFVCNVLSIVQQ